MFVRFDLMFDYMICICQISYSYSRFLGTLYVYCYSPCPKSK